MTKIVTYIHERVQNMTSEEREAKEIPFKRLRKEIFVKYFKLDPNISSKRAKKKYKKYPKVCNIIKEALEKELLRLFPKRKKRSAGVKSVVIPKEPHKSTAPENVTVLSRCGVSERNGSFMGRVNTSSLGRHSLYAATFFYEEEALIFVDKMKHKHNIPFVARGQSNRAKPQNVKGSLSMDWPLDVHRNSSELATAHKNGSSKEQRRILREKKKRLANSAATTASSSAIVNLATSSDDEDDDEDDGNDDPPPKSTKRSRNTSSTSSSTSSKLPPHKQMKLQ